MNEKILVITGPFILGEVLRRNQARVNRLCRRYGPKDKRCAAAVADMRPKVGKDDEQGDRPQKCIIPGHPDNCIIHGKAGERVSG